MKTVWIATVTHTPGPDFDTYASDTEEGARKQVYKFVKENWWNVEGSEDGEGNEYPETCPEDVNTAIDIYFDVMYCEGEGESLDVTEVEVK